MSVFDVAELDDFRITATKSSKMLVRSSLKEAAPPVQAATHNPTCLELFAGCGGLALGLAQAGFKHCRVVELDDQAYATLKNNQERGVAHIEHWPLVNGDVAEQDYSALKGRVDLVAGGPPCQPFSIGGKHLGPADPRNMWPEAIRAVREVRPKAFVFENVRGLLRPGWAAYLEYLQLALAWAGHGPSGGEDWQAHAARLRSMADCQGAASREYRVHIRPINTADFGAPQKRHRAIVMGVRTDVAEDWPFPEPTHSRDALLWEQYVDGTYWKRHGLVAPAHQGVGAAVDRVRSLATKPKELPWLTVRDALAGLAPPTTDAEPLSHHRLRLGARPYKKHTGSDWDEPAKALKAGDHGVPGGENMLAMADGSVRYFTLREMARLQGFPDNFNLGDGWKWPIRQLGNAVPVQVGARLGEHLRRLLGSANHLHLGGER